MPAANPELLNKLQASDASLFPPSVMSPVLNTVNLIWNADKYMKKYSSNQQK